MQYFRNHKIVQYYTYSYRYKDLIKLRCFSRSENGVSFKWGRVRGWWGEYAPLDTELEPVGHATPTLVTT